jgi:hypothetical protein
MADQRQTYSKDDEKGSQISSGASMKASGGGSGGEKSGPTGSSRSYPKGKSVRSTDWNPEKCGASTFGVNGV